jgi:hypothetical protein
MSMTPEERRAIEADRRRRYYQANKEKEAERRRRYNEANKVKVNERNRLYREANKVKVNERRRRYEEANKVKKAHRNRCRKRQIAFLKEDGSSFESWVSSLIRPTAAFETIANLQPDPGQTLAELIHELSGYAMEVCEQIANPPVIEDPQPAKPTPQPDLF